MKNITLKIAQNGGEYYGYATIKRVPNESNVVKNNKEVLIGDIAIEFDEYIEIIKIETV